MHNCSMSSEEGLSSSVTNQILYKNVFFNITNGAQKPDLLSISGDGTCAGANQSYVYNITSSVLDQNQKSCAVISPMTPTANPCVSALNASQAISIDSSLANTTCTSNLTNVICSPSAIPKCRASSSVASIIDWRLIRLMIFLVSSLSLFI